MPDMIGVTTTLVSARTGETRIVTTREPVETVDPAILWATFRAERDRMLAASDKYALPDFPQPAAARTAWLAYRKALRDLPGVTSNPLAPAWPKPPQG